MRSFAGKKVLIMGYGLNMGGSGPQAAKYLAQRGAQLTITDLRSAQILAPTMALLADYPVHWVLGEHRQSDFLDADFIVKNPGVHKDSAYLKDVKDIQTDISLFLQECQPHTIAITGSKGKSSISTLIFHVLSQIREKKTYLGGNITVSPLTYIDEIRNEDNLVLELSSWQTGDLIGKGLLKPQVTLITNLLADHQNYYKNNMQDYADDKSGIFLDQSADSWSVFNLDDEWCEYFSQRSLSQKAFFSMSEITGDYRTVAYPKGEKIILKIQGQEEEVCVENPCVLRQNLIAASLVLRLFGLSITQIEQGLSSFKGLAYRMEFLSEKHGVAYYNDTAATMPLASMQTIKHLSQLSRPIHLIFGGADKELDFKPIAEIKELVSSWHLLDGTAYSKIKEVLDASGISYAGPFASMQEVLASAQKQAQRGDIILLSPGAASFGIFLNEFDRGDQFKKLIGP